jgi:hypothetical protein
MFTTFQRCLLPPSYRWWVSRAQEIDLMMEAASTSEMLVNFYQTPRRNKPEVCYLHTRCLKNLISHPVVMNDLLGTMWNWSCPKMKLGVSKIRINCVTSDPQDYALLMLVIMRSLHKMNTYRADRVCLSYVSAWNRRTDFDEILYGYYGIGGHPNLVLFSLLQWVIQTWQTH